MTWSSVRMFLFGVIVELTWWAARPINALFNREKEHNA